MDPTSRLPRIQVACGDLNTFGMFRHHLQDEFEVLEPAIDSDSIRLIVAEEEVDLVILDFQTPGQSSPRLLRQLLEIRPDLLVIALLGSSDPDEVHRATIAGARDYLAPPMDQDSVLKVVRRAIATRAARLVALEQADQRAGVGIWSFLSASGGCGQTTLVLSVANELAVVGKRVVVVDLDWIFADVGFYLDLSPDPPSIQDLIEDLDPTDPASLRRYLKHHSSGIDVLTDPRQVSQAAGLDAEEVAAAVLTLPKIADYVLLDLPTGLSDRHLPYLDASAIVFDTSTGTYGGLKNQRRMVQVLLELGYSKQKIRPLLTTFNPKRADLDTFHQNLESYDVGLAFVFPEDRAAADRALGEGQPLSRIAPRSKFSLAVREFLAPTLAQARPPEPAPESKSLFERLFG